IRVLAAANAVLQVFGEDQLCHLGDGTVYTGELGQKIAAGASFVHHFPDAVQLAADAGQTAVHVGGMLAVGAVHSGSSSWLWNIKIRYAEKAPATTWKTEHPAQPKTGLPGVRNG